MRLEPGSITLEEGKRHTALAPNESFHNLNVDYGGSSGDFRPRGTALSRAPAHSTLNRGNVTIFLHHTTRRGAHDMAMNLISTLAGSLMEGFLPAGWDLARIDACCAVPPERIQEPQAWWHPEFAPIACDSVADFDVMMGHEIARTIRRTRQAERPAALILPVGPMGMYRWAVYFPERMGRGLRSCSRIQHGRMERPRGQHAPGRGPGGLSERDGGGVLRSARRPHRARRAALVCHVRPAAALRRAHRRTEAPGRRADGDLRHRPGLPHRLLGAALRRRVRHARRTGRPRRTGSEPGSTR